ncbi:MAG: hypothetical protein AB9873_17275 [Syntrophobacteraceae bacterium]
MHESLRALCNRYGVFYTGEPRQLPHSQTCWLLVGNSGEQWIAKLNRPDDKSVEMLRSFKMLHPHFRHPVPLSSPEDGFLLYASIPGQVLADGRFDEPEVIETVFEVIGRFRAMMRSLSLVPFLEEKLNKSRLPPDRESLDSAGPPQGAARSESVEPMPTRLQIAGSFHWARRLAAHDSELIASLGLWPGAPIGAFREQLDRHLSIHIPVVGNNLSHTAMHPEHLLLCENGEVGIVGWHIEPRPRFYMNHTYLAWALLRAETPALLSHCRDYLSRERTRDFYKDHQLVLALCLLEQLAEMARPTPSHRASQSHSGIALAEALFRECVENVADHAD